MSRLPLHWWGLNSAGTPQYPCQDAHSHPKPKSCGICAFCSPPMHRHKGLTLEPPQRDPQPLLLPAQAAKPPPPAPLGCFVRLHVVHPARGLQKLQHPPELLQSPAGLLGGSVGMHTALRRGVHGETCRSVRTARGTARSHAPSCLLHQGLHAAVHTSQGLARSEVCNAQRNVCAKVRTAPGIAHAPTRVVGGVACSLHQGVHTLQHAVVQGIPRCTPLQELQTLMCTLHQELHAHYMLAAPGFAHSKPNTTQGFAHAEVHAAKQLARTDTHVAQGFAHSKVGPHHPCSPPKPLLCPAKPQPPPLHPHGVCRGPSAFPGCWDPSLKLSFSDTCMPGS